MCNLQARKKPFGIFYSEGRRQLRIDEVLVSDDAVYNGPQDGNATLNAWVEGGYIAWLDGRLKYD